MTLYPGQEIHNNRYRIVAPLGAGGMGAVYRAWDKSLNLPVALKENLDTTQGAQELFIQEARILARLSHPNLPRVTDYFVIPGMGQYLVMDFIEGKDLRELAGFDTSSPNALPEDQVLVWITQVCGAVEYLHNQEPPIIHRDIKPDNIKIKNDGRAMLVDFGIAKIFNPGHQTSSAARRGTPGYAPPEQYGMARTDARSDIYALGATLYAVLTGVEPPDSVDLLCNRASLTPPRKLNQSIRRQTATAISQCMTLESDRRYQTARQLNDALQAKPQTIKKQPVSLATPASFATSVPSPAQAAVSAPVAKPASIPGLRAKSRLPKNAGKAILVILLFLSVLTCLAGILLSNPKLMETFGLPTAWATEFASWLPGQPTEMPRPAAQPSQTIRPPVIMPGSNPEATDAIAGTLAPPGSPGGSPQQPKPTLSLVKFTVNNISNKEAWISVDRLTASGTSIPLLKTSLLKIGSTKTVSGYYGPSNFKLTWSCGGGKYRDKVFKVNNSLVVKINNQCNVTQ